MTSQKLSELPLLTGTEIAADDRFYLADASAGANGSKAIVYSQLSSALAVGAAGVTTGLFNSRAEAAASTISPAVQWVRTEGYAIPGDGGGARYKQVVAATAYTFTTANGLFFELAEPYELTLEMFGGKADSTTDHGGTMPNGTDNWAALQLALGYSRYNIYRTYSAISPIRLLRGIYYVSQTTDIHWNSRISGVGGAALGKSYPGSILSYPANVTAFHYWASSTTGSQGKDSYASILENVMLMGRGGTLTYFPQIDGTYIPPDLSDPTKHGVIMNTTICMRGVSVVNFAGDGIHVTTLQAGSANELSFLDVKCGSNGRHGMYIEGGDTNAGSGVRCDFANSGGMGLYDSSAYGNVWTGCHFDSNGMKARVSYGGNRYHCVAYAYGYSAAGDPSLVVPGTDEAVWAFQNPGGVDFFYQQWVSGNKYFAGGSYTTVPAAAGTGGGLAHLFSGCYMEGPQGSPRLNDETVVIQGGNAQSAIGGTIITGAGVQRHWGVRQAVRAKINTTGVGTSLKLGATDFDPIRLYANEEERLGSNTQGFGIGSWNSTSGTFDIVHGVIATSVSTTNATVAKISNYATTELMAGRPAILPPGRVVFPNPIFVGRTAAGARMLSFDTTVPAVGSEFAKGDVVFNSNPVAGGKAGWICTQGGAVATTPLWSAAAGIVGLNQYVKNAAGKFYRCTFDPQTLKAFTEPVHTFNPVGAVLGDGYSWDYAGPAGVIRTAWAVGLNPILNDVYRGASNRMYKCTLDPGATLTSGVAPSGTVVGVQEIGADGYGWTLLEKLWVTATVYPVGAIVEVTSLNAVYRCTTSPGTPSTVQPAHMPTAALADLIQWDYLCHPATVPLWVDNTNYPVGSIVRNTGGTISRCLAKINDAYLSTTEPTPQFEKPTLPYANGYIWGYVCNMFEVETPKWLFGRTYLAITTNEFSNLVVNNTTGDAYRCIAPRLTDILSTVEPTHSTGEVLLADGYKWAFISDVSPIWKAFGAIDP